MSEGAYKIHEKFKKKAHTEISDREIEQLKLKFYDTPIFLHELEYLVSEFVNEQLNIYQIQPNITTLQEHIKYFKRESLKKKLASYREVLLNYDQVIEKIMEDKIQCNKTNMNRAVFISIVEQLKDDKDKLTAFLQQVRENQNENIHIRLSSWSSIGAQVANGFFTMVRGAAEIISTPYSYLIKIPSRMYITVTKTKESNMKDSAEKLKKAIEIQTTKNRN